MKPNIIIVSSSINCLLCFRIQFESSGHLTLQRDSLRDFKRLERVGLDRDDMDESEPDYSGFKPRSKAGPWYGLAWGFSLPFWWKYTKCTIWYVLHLPSA